MRGAGARSLRRRPLEVHRRSAYPVPDADRSRGKASDRGHHGLRRTSRRAKAMPPVASWPGHWASISTWYRERTRGPRAARGRRGCTRTAERRRRR